VTALYNQPGSHNEQCLCDLCAQDRYIAEQEEDDNVYCANGHPCDWEDCTNCGGEGHHDAYEIDPLWYDPGDTEPCDQCDGKGGWWLCLERCGGEPVPSEKI
jgi:hypothetical protein